MKQRLKNPTLITTIIIAMLLGMLALTLFFGTARHAPQAAAEETAPSYTTTDKLYLTIPDTSKKMTFSTIGGEVNGGVHSDDVDSVSDTLDGMRNWFELYITRNDGKSWNVPKADVSDGKWYFDPAKHALGGSVSLYLKVKSDMPSNKLYTFLCNGDCLWQRRHNPYLAHPCDDGCAMPIVKVSTNSGTLYNGNPFTDSRVLQVQQSMSIGAGNGWKVTSHNMSEHTLGINPTVKTVKLASVPTGTGTCTVSFDYYVGAYITWSHLQAGPGQNANRAKSQRDNFSVTFSTKADNAKPVLSAPAEYSQSSVSATWTDDTYTFGKYSRNGSDCGEYTQGVKLTDEGKYIITATDNVGNSANVTLFVDKTAPRFANEFYDAADKLLTKHTKESSYKLQFPTAGTNESPINQTATYVYSYYDSAAKRVITMPAEYYKNGDTLTQQGKYVITVTDAAGNSSSCTVIIDRTPPEFTTLQYSKTSVYASYSASDAESPITATYTHITSSGTSTARSYSSGMRLDATGKYVITATDAAGNMANTTLYVDNTAPTLSRSFEYGKTDGSATFSYTAWESPVTAVYSYVGVTETKTNVTYTSGQDLHDDGEYTITATDKAGNATTTKIIVDRKAPTLTFSDGTTGTSQITRGSSSVAWKVERYESPVTVTYSFKSTDESKAPSVINAAYTSGNVFTAEGTYDFTASDRAGNVTNATVIIDNTPPSLTFAANGIAFERYTNTLFTARGTDELSGIDKIELYENGKYVMYDFAPRSDNGAYLFRVTDKAGNATSATATVYKTDTFGNLAAIRDGYKLNAWYVVTLPARIFTTPNNDIAGRYSFESYDKALAFAVAKERAFRVTTVQGGFMYVSSSNESVAQKYEDENTLNTVVEKYAKGYISTRQTANTSGNDKFYTEPESLTRNSPILPDYLLDLKDLPRYFARPATLWRLPNVSYISEMPYTVTARYLGDFTEETAQKETVIPNGSTLSSLDDYRQGFYLITERDGAGNVEQYIIYSDAELPTARVTATFGDGNKDFVLDYDYTQNETLYFLSLGFESLLDNSDAFITLKIEKGNTAKFYTQADELPILGSEEYTSGKYTVTVFDRSLNALVFDVFIAGAAPTMSHGSLAADKPDCKISFVTSDRFNVITGITLYKIEYDGSKTVLDTDGNGVPINAATLSYTLTVGGKYGATVTDNYRRTVELDPIFFLKGLPSGKLTGVKDGGRTNKNVSFTFDNGDVAEFFTLHPNGERRPFNGYTVQTGAAQTTYNIAADDNTSFEYLIFLHTAQDLSLFVEYTFEIDTILPTFEITDSDGNVIEPDGATNKSFSIKWSETGVSMRYYTARSGQLGATKYNMNAVLSQGTLYYFTLKDDVGNELEFTVLLDNAVDYKIDGKYNEVNGVLYAKAPITFTVNEPTQEFSVVNSDDYTIENGGTLTQAGRYEITVTDNYRNTVKLIIVLDFTPPTIGLSGVENGGAVKSDVSITASDYDYLYLADRLGNKIKDIESGATFSDAGRYYITASDHAGNTVTLSFTIDLTVDYALSVPNGAVTTKAVTLSTDEPLTIVTTKDGVVIDTPTRFVENGVYELTLTDALGNSVSCVFVILPERARTIDQKLPVGTRIVSITKDGATFAVSDSDSLSLEQTGTYIVTLDCGGVPYELTLSTDCTPPVVTLTKDGNNVKISQSDKENITLKLTKDGEEINCSIGKTLSEPGHYILTATDELGNVAVYEFDIPYRLNTWAIVAIVVGAIVLLVIIVLVIRARRKPRMK